jgi:hypothetical protein
MIRCLSGRTKFKLSLFKQGHWNTGWSDGLIVPVKTVLYSQVFPRHSTVLGNTYVQIGGTPVPAKEFDSTAIRRTMKNGKLLLGQYT